MAKRHTDIFIQAAALDQYIHLADPRLDPVAQRVIIKRINESRDLYQYFFAQGPSAGWADALLEAGFFSNPPAVIQEESGFRTPTWPPSGYLAMVAREVPRVVSVVVSQIDTDNPLIHMDLVRALLAAPIEDAILRVDKIKQWLNGKFVMAWWGLPEAVSQLALSFSENGKPNESLELLNELLRPVVAPISKTGEMTLGAIAKSRFELDYLQPDLWEEILPGLEQWALQGVIDLLRQNLQLAIRLELEAEGRGNETNSWHSHDWRASVGDSTQNSDHYYKDKLLVALRRSIERLVDCRPHEGRAVLESCLNSEAPIEKRVGLYLLSIRASLYPDLVSALLVDSALHNNRTCLAFKTDRACRQVAKSRKKAVIRQWTSGGQ